MRIYIMRHGQAEGFASSDEERQLTERGRFETLRMADWLKDKLETVDLVLVSPYIRAQQTWQVCQSVLPKAKKIMTEPDITPYGQSDQVASYLRALAVIEKPKNILVVSHLPLVGYLTAEFDQTITPPMFATSSVSCINYDDVSTQSELLWVQDVAKLALTR